MGTNMAQPHGGGMLFTVHSATHSAEVELALIENPFGNPKAVSRSQIAMKIYETNGRKERI
jgi:hypothetical protein